MSLCKIGYFLKLIVCIFLLKAEFYCSKCLRIEDKSGIIPYDNTPMQYTAIFHGGKMVIFR